MVRAPYQRAAALLAALAIVSSIGCEKAKEQQRKRTEAKRAHVEQRYEELGFLVEALDEAAAGQKTCDDDAIRKGQRRSSRKCRRLALVDEAYLRVLFGEKAGGDAEDLERWAWMRTGAFRDLRPVGDVESINDVTRHARELEGLEDTLVGVFTENEAGDEAAPTRYRGWLRLYDVKDEALRCQLRLDLDVSKFFSPPPRPRGGTVSRRTYVEAFRRALDRELRTITKNFCAD